MTTDNVVQLKEFKLISQSQKVAMQCAINAKLAMCALRGRGYVTATDAGEIVIIARLLEDTQAVEGTSANLAAAQTQGTTTQTAASAAMEEALDDHVASEAVKASAEG